MKLKVKDQKDYKGDPQKGHPILQIPLRNGDFAFPGQSFSTEAVLGGEESMESLLKEKPCRVSLIKESAPTKVDKQALLDLATDREALDKDKSEFEKAQSDFADHLREFEVRAEDFAKEKADFEKAKAKFEKEKAKPK